MCIYEIIHGIYPKWLLILPTTGNITCVQTSQVNSVCQKITYSHKGTADTEHADLVIWDQLPHNIRNIQNSNTLKNKERDIY